MRLWTKIFRFNRTRLLTMFRPFWQSINLNQMCSSLKESLYQEFTNTFLRIFSRWVMLSSWCAWHFLSYKVWKTNTFKNSTSKSSSMTNLSTLSMAPSDSTSESSSYASLKELPTLKTKPFRESEKSTLAISLSCTSSLTKTSSLSILSGTKTIFEKIWLIDFDRI